MNRLILIGNGFDLAHGLKTSYSDFIKWYFEKCLQDCIHGKEQSELLSVKINAAWNYQAISEEQLGEWIDDCFNEGFNASKIGQPRFDGTFLSPFVFGYPSDLFQELLARTGSHRWVDIENVFYELLLKILDFKADESKEHALRLLNKSMRLIIKELQEYLTGLKSADKIDEYSNIIYSAINVLDVQSKPIKFRTQYNRDFETSKPKETLILNFNYTNTIGLYMNSPSLKRPDHISIHGRLNDLKNPIIFGFGDEVDKRYEEIENSRAKGWFEYIKSFWYLKTNNYRELTSFIDSKEYQVLVLGHSCGLSDRTMLQMIFQHDNCRSIKLYYHGSKEINNHRQTLHELARHFKDKGLMRRRIVSEDNSERMPQFND